MKRALNRGLVYEILGCDFEQLEKIYLSPDNDLAHVLHQMATTDRNLLILYAELGSIRKVARIYNMGSTTILREINRIRKEWFTSISHA